MIQLNLFDDVPNQDLPDSMEDAVEVKNGRYLLLKNFFSAQESNFYFSFLEKNILWKQESMNIYGKNVLFPRLTSWYGEKNKSYSFSGLTLNPNIWNDELLEIKTKIENFCNVTFNSVLLNLYRDGNDSISWHSDNEEELGINPIIASANFGASRKFQLRHVITKEKIDINLTNGSLLIMFDELQHFWQHQIPKSKQMVGKRINLTFRYIK